MSIFAKSSLNGFAAPHTANDQATAPGYSAAPGAVASDVRTSENGGRFESVPPIEAERPNWMHDVLPRRRDEQGNSLSHSYAYDVPAVEDVPLEQTPWARLVSMVQQCNAGEAYDLHAFYDHKLRPSIRRMLDVRRQEEAAVIERNRVAKAHNEQLDTKIAQVKAAQEQATQTGQASLLEQDQPLAQAHQEAGHRVGLTGGFYDPQNPDPACVLRHDPASLEALAAELRLPWTPDDEKARLPKALASVLTVGIGLLIGISLGLLGRFFTPDLLLRKWPLVLMFALVGVVVAATAGESLKLFFKAVSERYWLGRPASNWAPLLVAGLMFAAALLVIDSYVEQQGLMVLVRQEDAMRALSHHAVSSGAPSFFYFLAGMILSLPYITMNIWHGYLLGRYQACLNRLIEERDRRFANTDTATRKQIEVQQALAAISRVHDLLRAKQTLEARLSATQVRFQAERAQLEAQRLDDKTGLDDAAKARIQDAVKNYHGAQREWDELLATAKKCWVPAQRD